jgi:hypothetical protein
MMVTVTGIARQGDSMAKDDVTITLSQNEALVLYEWLVRVDEGLGIPIEHPSELRVLWRLEGKLEKQIDSLFSDEYLAVLESARDEITRLYGA